MRAVIDWRTCERCGRRFRTTGQRRYQERAGEGRIRHCSRPCQYAALRDASVYADARERMREKKRRKRARLHARGLTNAGKRPTSGPWYRAAMSRWVAPTGGSRR